MTDQSSAPLAYYVDATGNYLGSFASGATIPAGAVQVPTPPPSPIFVWNASASPPAWQQIGVTYYVDASGNFLGGFGGGAAPPAGATQVSAPPPDVNHVWNATASAWKLNAPGALAALAAKASALIAAGYLPSGLASVTKTLALDPDSLNKITAQGAAADIAILKANGAAVATAYTLPCADGTLATAAASDCAAAAEAVRLYVQAIDVNAAALAASIAAASDPSTVDVTQGWPAAGS
ncbi:MAG TPA: hypothetical protein VMF53_15965 [Alphaproteobacteria bacterium]|nr:hypothetical protein [Alphaproteobacteria bacterium]